MNRRVGKGARPGKFVGPVQARKRAPCPRLEMIIIEPSCRRGGQGMTCIDPRGHGAFRAFAHPTWSALAIVVAATIAAHVAALAQGLDVKGLDVKRYNPSEWTKGRFSEVVTVTGPGKIIYLA